MSDIVLLESMMGHSCQTCGARKCRLWWKEASGYIGRPSSLSLPMRYTQYACTECIVGTRQIVTKSTTTQENEKICEDRGYTRAVKCMYFTGGRLCIADSWVRKSCLTSAHVGLWEGLSELEVLPEKPIPENYRCQECDSTNCKLWAKITHKRSVTCTWLYCIFCIARKNNTDVSLIDEFGMDEHFSYFIGGAFPAIPSQDNSVYFAPSASRWKPLLHWWWNLPTVDVHPQELFFR